MKISFPAKAPWIRAGLALALLPAATSLFAQAESLRPGVNENFLSEDASVERFVNMFEGESREIYLHRDEIVEAIGLKSGESIADIGAGTGFFSRLFAEIVGRQGRVYSVDISPALLEHMRTVNRELGLDNIEVLEGGERDIRVGQGVIDRAFVCDTYHHFEYPQDMLRSIHAALRPGGELVIVDFERVVGVSSEFAVDHMRAGKGTFSDEVRDAGFDFVEEVPMMEEQYFLRFRKR